MNTLQDIRLASAAACKEGRLHDAVKLIEEGLGHAPQDPDFLFVLTAAHLSLKNWQSAVKCGAALLDAAAADPERGMIACQLLTRAIDQSAPATFTQHYQQMRKPLNFAADRLDDKAFAKYFFAAASMAVAAGDAETAGHWLRRQYHGVPGIDHRTAISPTARVADWCRENSAVSRHIGTEQEISVRNGAFSASYVTSPLSVSVIPGGEILCGWDYAVTPGGQVLTDSCYLPLDVSPMDWIPHFALPALSRVLHIWPEQTTHIDADVIFLHAPSGYHVGHWICDFLPRLRALHQDEFRKMKIGVPRQLPRKQRELLSLFGIDQEQLIECDLAARYTFRNLVVVQPGDALRPSLETTQFLGDAMRGPRPASGLTRRIFLLRSTPTRTILNMDAVTAVLDARGFEYLDLAHTSIAEQRLRLGAADVVICIYGSDLLAALFMQPGADLIELKYRTEDLSPDDLVCCTDPMLSVLQINFHILVGSVQAKPKTSRLKKDHDFVVDCAELSRVLDDITARKASGTDHIQPMDVHVSALPDQAPTPDHA